MVKVDHFNIFYNSYNFFSSFLSTPWTIHKVFKDRVELYILRLLKKIEPATYDLKFYIGNNYKGLIDL